ncbi:VOC family protein [Oceanobacillus piezotolerans]|uniref:VOC family protein n=1 Tax=Oceanobacillus piezotolerans TaxID=2448030 RepID=A0A498D9F6_9BACI|nr:VOC family protein [Oceanobacillus piezotolerans]RLL45447.1 VOC family protein [Oceanobacillus piezotolerans]
MFKIGGIFIPVTNVKKSIEWYEKNLGAKLIDSWEDGAGFYLPNGSTQLALVEVDTKQPTEFVIKGNKKNSYYNFVVDDINLAYKHFHENNVTTTPIKDFGGMKYFDFYDLDQNPFSVVDEQVDSPFHSNNVRKLQNMD